MFLVPGDKLEDLWHLTQARVLELLAESVIQPLTLNEGHCEHGVSRQVVVDLRQSDCVRKRRQQHRFHRVNVCSFLPVVKLLGKLVLDLAHGNVGTVLRALDHFDGILQTEQVGFKHTSGFWELHLDHELLRVLPQPCTMDLPDTCNTNGLCVKPAENLFESTLPVCKVAAAPVLSLAQLSLNEGPQLLGLQRFAIVIKRFQVVADHVRNVRLHAHKLADLDE
mmetsp:Transcript_91795/g.213474  ORF Transcript_91795/g.213474 Transcript_91795/m.213474 type:complete len:223 (-) Transcript_91795:662-1330(-)